MADENKKYGKKRKRESSVGSNGGAYNSEGGVMTISRENADRTSYYSIEAIERTCAMVSVPIFYNQCQPSDDEKKDIEEFDLQFSKNPEVKRIFKKELSDKGTCYCLCYYWANQRDFFLGGFAMCDLLKKFPSIKDWSFNPSQNKVVECKEGADLDSLVYNAGLMIIINKNY